MHTKTYFQLLCFFALAFSFTGSAQDIENSYRLKKPATRFYNITASETHQFIWFRVAKIGTRTILAGLEGIPLSINDYTVPYRTEDFQGYFKFAFVRNPWDRVVSCYCNKVLTHTAFTECFDKGFDFFVDFINQQDLTLADPHIRLQCKLFPLEDVDYVGRFERFEEDLKYIFSNLHIDAPILHKNASKHAHYSQYYTERTKNIIGRKYKADIQLFDYQFEHE